MRNSDQLTSDEAKLKGNEFYKNSNYAEAYKWYSQAISLIENDLSNESKSIYYSNRANAAFFMNPIDYAEVIRDCNISIRFNKNNIKPYYRRVVSFIKEEEPNKAEKCLNQMKKLFNSQENTKNQFEELENLLKEEKQKYLTPSYYNKEEKLTLNYLDNMIKADKNLDFSCANNSFKSWYFLFFNVFIGLASKIKMKDDEWENLTSGLVLNFCPFFSDFEKLKFSLEKKIDTLEKLLKRGEIDSNIGNLSKDLNSTEKSMEELNYQLECDDKTSELQFIFTSSKMLLKILIRRFYITDKQIINDSFNIAEKEKLDPQEYVDKLVNQLKSI